MTAPDNSTADAVSPSKVGVTVNLEKIAELRDLLGEDFGSVVEVFLRDCMERLSCLQTAFTKQDGQGLRREAHTLKGSSANMGATALAEIAFALQKAADKNNLDVATLIEQLQAEYTRVVQALEKFLPTPCRQASV